MLSDLVQTNHICFPPEPRGLQSLRVLPLGFLLPLGSILGCKLASPSGRTEVIPTQDVVQAVDALVSTIKNTQSTVTNDVWPWVVMVGLLLLVPVAGFIVWYWIKSYTTKNSYISQKPVYEAMKGMVNGNAEGEFSNGAGFVSEGNLRSLKRLRL